MPCQVDINDCELYNEATSQCLTVGGVVCHGVATTGAHERDSDRNGAAGV